MRSQTEFGNEKKTDLLVEGTREWLKKHGENLGIEFYYGNARGPKKGVLKRVYP